MRNFIVAFMLLILLSSIMFVLLKPVHQNEVKNTQAEKTHVEKLLTEPSHIEIEEKTEPTETMPTKESEKIITEMINNVPYENFVDKEETPDKREITSEEKNIKQTLQTAANNEDFQAISKELMEKYGNNPNAEVSEDDVHMFMIKMIESARQQH